MRNLTQAMPIQAYLYVPNTWAIERKGKKHEKSGYYDYNG